MHKTVIFHVVPNEQSEFYMREYYILRVYVKAVMTLILWTLQTRCIMRMKNNYTEELLNLHFSPNVIMVKKRNRLLSAVQIAHMGNMTNE
jgi:hypothetical protein